MGMWPLITIAYSIDAVLSTRLPMQPIPTMCDNTLSMRMAHTVEGLLPGIDATVKNRASTLIDLATAENWLIRDELVAQYKAGIEQAFSSKVLHHSPLPCCRKGP